VTATLLASEWSHVLISGLVSGIVVAVVNARLSETSFVSQRWWERRADAYAGILKCLADIRVALNDFVDAHQESISAESLQLFLDRSNTAALSLSVVVNQGTFLLSADALTLLHRLQRSMNDVEAGSESLQGFRRLAHLLHDGVEGIAKVAHKDIGVRGSRGSFPYPFEASSGR
jgi:hypothetical protein